MGIVSHMPHTIKGTSAGGPYTSLYLGQYGTAILRKIMGGKGAIIGPVSST